MKKIISSTQNSLLLLVILFTLAGKAYSQKEIYSLDGEWTIKDFKIGMGMYWPEKWVQLVYFPRIDSLTNNSLEVQVPTSVQKAYRDAKLLPDPYVEFNVRKYRWMEDREWWFVRTFEAPASWENKDIDINCAMINYRADVWVNNIWCGRTVGNYMPLDHDISKAIKPGQTNTVFVRFRAPENSSEEIPNPWFTIQNGFHRRPHVTPTNPQVSEFLMSSCLFGWDWGPHLVPIGFLQPVYLTADEHVEIEQPYIYTTSLSENHDRAELSFSVSVENEREEKVNGKLNVSIEPKGKPGEVVFQKSYEAEIDKNAGMKFQDNIRVNHPDLWWPVNMGDQNLYRLKLEFVTEDDVILANENKFFGIRKIEKIFNEDPNWLKGVELDYGEEEYPWTFVVNDRKLFIKGMNWIPVDAMLDLKTERYNYLIRLAEKANINMFRVWGEGLYETETFYNLCDSLGIMVWQDFWVGGYSDAQPQDKSELAIKKNIIRTRNHPSLVLFCGGNEFDASIEARLAQLNKLKSLCEEYAPDRFFHFASPFGGDRHGGMGIKTKEERQKANLRFVSEGGYQQSWPPKSDMVKFIPENRLFPVIDNLDILTFHNSFLGIDFRYHRNDKLFGRPENLDELIYIEMHRNIIGWQSQLENTRVDKFKTSGCLFWAHNDVWPVTSWSMIDYYGTCKNHYYTFKKSASPVLPVASQKYEILKPGELYDLDVTVVNDKYENIQDLKLVAEILMGEKADKVYMKEFHGTALANNSTHFGKLDYVIPQNTDEHNFLLRLKLYNTNNELVNQNDYTCHIGNENRQSITLGFWGEYRLWAKNKVDFKIKAFPKKLARGEEKDFQLVFKNNSENIVMGLEFLLTNLPEGLRLYLDDNYLNLLPGEERTVKASIENNLEDKNFSEIKLKTLVDGWNVVDENGILVLQTK